MYASLEANWGINQSNVNKDASYIILNRAIKLYKEAIALYQSYPIAHFKLAYAQYMNGYFNDAVLSFNKAIELDPTVQYEISLSGGIPIYLKNLRGVTYYNRGIAKFKYGDKKGACLDLKKAEDLGFNYDNLSQFIVPGSVLPILKEIVTNCN